MAIRAYNECYLNEAKRHLGVATDYLVNSAGFGADRVGFIYSTSPTMTMFGMGDPGVVAGMSGTELGQRLWREVRGGDGTAAPTRQWSDEGKSPEYWAGWALAHFQWHWCKSFKWIFARVTLSAVIAKYAVYHEMDVMRFLEEFMDELTSVKTEPNLRRIRRAAGYTQSQLARLAEVNVRNIQLYEQGVQNINRASAEVLARLARPLSCTIEDLME